tara:strand:- start:378 stop:548 length:171 start_codon:yes stop_codon:yes gene_type:complete
MRDQTPEIHLQLEEPPVTCMERLGFWLLIAACGLNAYLWAYFTFKCLMGLGNILAQ